MDSGIEISNRFEQEFIESPVNGFATSERNDELNDKLLINVEGEIAYSSSSPPGHRISSTQVDFEMFTTDVPAQGKINSIPSIVLQVVDESDVEIPISVEKSGDSGTFLEA
jgi:hypothetical protein